MGGSQVGCAPALRSVLGATALFVCASARRSSGHCRFSVINIRRRRTLARLRGRHRAPCQSGGSGVGRPTPRQPFKNERHPGVGRASPSVGGRSTARGVWSGHPRVPPCPAPSRARRAPHPGSASSSTGYGATVFPAVRWVLRGWALGPWAALRRCRPTTAIELEPCPPALAATPGSPGPARCLTRVRGAIPPISLCGSRRTVAHGQRISSNLSPNSSRRRSIRR